MSVLLFVIIAGCILSVFSGAYVFWVACAKREDVDWLDEQAVSKTQNAQYYPYIVESDRWLKKNNAQDVYTVGKDGIVLHGLWIPAENCKGTVLMAHGYRSTMLLDCHLAFELFHQLGMNILVPEQRTHGQTGGRFITFGVKESGDMQQWLRFCNSTLSADPIVLYGISMGASTMLYLADKALPDNVKGIIADCGFTSPKAIISHVYRSVLHLPAAPAVWIAGVFAKLIAGFSLDACDTVRSLRRSRLPVAMIHGMADGFVPWEMTVQGYDNCRTAKKLLLVPKAEHGLSFLGDGFGYTATVIDFLKENISGFCVPESRK